MLPYEREIGKSPTLGRLRELVVMRKFRPLCRLTLWDNNVSSNNYFNKKKKTITLDPGENCQNNARYVGQ